MTMAACPGTTRALLTEIEAFLAEFGVSRHQVRARRRQRRALIKNLRSGASVTLKTADKVRAYMAQQRSRRPGAAMFHVKRSPPGASC